MEAEVNASSKGLIGSVRSVQTEIVKIHKQGESYTEKFGGASQTVIYDISGRITQKITHGSKGISNSPLVVSDVKTVFIYSNDGTIQETVEYAGDRFRSTLYTYDAAGTLTNESQYGDNGVLLNEISYTRAVDGRTVSESFIPLPNKSLHDSNENLTEEIAYGHQGELLYKTVFVYRADGNLIEKNVFINSILIGRMLGESDRNAEMIRASKVVYAYDADGRIIEESETGTDESSRSKRVYNYDVGRNVFDKFEYSVDGSFRRIRYSREVDAYGNWIKEATLEWNVKTTEFEPTGIIFREISYY